MACCPAHDDHNPSLSILDGNNGKPVVMCFAGCSYQSIIAALSQRGLWPISHNGNGNGHHPPAEVFDIATLRRQGREKYPGDAVSSRVGAPRIDRKAVPHVPASPRKGTGLGRIVATYDYQDEQEELLFQALRYDPKDFRQRQPDGDGGWTWSLKGVRYVLYRLPQVLKVTRVYIVEGEKDVATMETLGLTATTSPMGAGKWKDEYSAFLKTKQVVDR